MKQNTTKGQGWDKIKCKLGIHNPAATMQLTTYCTKCGKRGVWMYFETRNIFDQLIPTSLTVKWLD